MRALELLDYTNYEGDYEDEMGIGRPPEFTPLLEIPDLLIMAWGATVPMIAHAVGIELDEITTTWEKWVTPTRPQDRQGRHRAGQRRGDPLHDQRRLRRPRGASSSSTSTGSASTPRRTGPRGTGDDVYRVEIDGSPSITQETAFRFTDGTGRAPAVAGCLATGLRALNAVPAVNDLPAGWVTALDLPLIPGVGTIR